MLSTHTTRLLRAAQLSILSAGREVARSNAHAAVRAFSDRNTDWMVSLDVIKIADTAEIVMFMLDLMDWLERKTPGDAPPAQLPPRRGRPSLRLVGPEKGDTP